MRLHFSISVDFGFLSCRGANVHPFFAFRRRLGIGEEVRRDFCTTRKVFMRRETNLSTSGTQKLFLNAQLVVSSFSISLSFISLPEMYCSTLNSTCSAAVHTRLQYMLGCSTCSAAVPARQQYMPGCSTCPAAVHARLQYMLGCSTHSAAVHARLLCMLGRCAFSVVLNCCIVVLVVFIVYE